MLGPAPEHDTTTIAAGVKSGIDWPTPAATEPPQPALLQFPDSTLEALGDKQAEQEEGEKGDLAKQDILSGDIDTGHLSEGGEGGVAGGVMATTSSLSRAHIPAGTQDQSYDYRYEFSETRKVLEEFFKAENEFPASSSPPMGLSSPPLGLSNPPMGLQPSPPGPPHTQQSIHTAYRSSQGGADLDYSLKRHAGVGRGCGAGLQPHRRVGQAQWGARQAHWGARACREFVLCFEKLFEHFPGL